MNRLWKLFNMAMTTLTGFAHELITYGGGLHIFTVFGGNRYQETADKKSWQRFTEFLAGMLKN